MSNRISGKTAATTPASDDNFVLDGVTNGTRKLAASVLPLNKVLLGGQTSEVASSGVLQFPAGSGDATSGMTFAGDVLVYRPSAGKQTIRSTGAEVRLILQDNASGTGASDGVYVGLASGAAALFNYESGIFELGTNGAVVLTLGTAKEVTVEGALIGRVQSLSGPGAVNLTTLHTEVTSTGVGDALTLANGVAGQVKTITMGVDGGTAVLTPTTKTGFSTITFTNAGDGVTLRYLATRGWTVIGSYGVTIAP